MGDDGTKATAEDLWEWLASCRTCGKTHTMHEWADEGGTIRGSWADLEDGHTFYRRLSGADLAPLMVEWEQR